MATNLYLQYDAADTGSRPLPAGATFWVSPAVVLATPDGNYTVGTTPTIDVQVSITTPTAFEIINVEVWVCDPTTVAGPSTALPPFQGATASQLTLTGFFEPKSGQLVSSIPVIPVTGFAPYPGISSLPGGHCCLIANCWGLSADGTSDGTDLDSEAAINLPTEVQTDPHVAQHNIFADAPPMGQQQRIISFPFKAATPLRTGTEQVSLEISHLNRVIAVPQQHLTFLRQGRFKALPLHSSTLPVKAFAIGGVGVNSAHHVSLQLQADKPTTLTVELTLDDAEPIGGVHAFDVVQKAANGKTEGGFRLLAVVDR
jgi:hypothetical protein